MTRHIFLSYVRENAKDVDRLARDLEARGAQVWLDREQIAPGQRWKEAVIAAIRKGNLFVACFSREYSTREKAYMNEELTVAVEELRQRPVDRNWFVPVSIDGSPIPRRGIGGGATLHDLQWVDLSQDWESGVARIAKAASPKAARRPVGRSETSSGGSGGGPKRIVEILRRLEGVVAPALPSEFHDVERVRAARKPLKGEVFLIELLDDPIELKREGEGITITVDRSNVSKCITSNDDKSKLSRWIERSKALIRVLDRKDTAIQSFLTDPQDKGLTIDPDELGVPLRWASGGVLSLVTFHRKEWVPLFFRDIPPYGWNLSLGATEREFDEQGRALLLNDREHRTPRDFISREFCEESIVTDRPPDHGTPSNPVAFRPLNQGDQLSGPDMRRWRKHVALRRRCDELGDLDKLSEAPGIPLERVQLRNQITLQVRSKAFGEDPDETRPVDNVLVCFSLRDLGIEVVNVFRYELHENDYLLDGEIDEKGCLVRMPMALFSMEYLASVFGQGVTGEPFVLKEGKAPSSKVGRAPKVSPDPTESDLVPYLWDIEQRMRIIKGEKDASPHEVARFNEWHSLSGTYFLDADGRPSLANPSRLFVPSTAKILHLYFSGLAK